MTQPEKPKDLLDWLGIKEAPRWMVSRLLGALFSVVLALLLALALAAAFGMLCKAVFSFGGATPESPGNNLGTGGLIVALLGAPFLIWNTIIKQKALGFQKEGHLTDRISKAVEHLGAEKTVKRPGADGTAVEQTEPNIEVRIGGILSLERIAQDSCTYDKGRDHVRVMEILCAYVRENTPASGVRTSWRQRYEDETTNNEDHGGITHTEFADQHFHGNEYDLHLHICIEGLQSWARSLPAPRQDIALTLKVISRRNAAQLLAEARWGKDASPDTESVFDDQRKTQIATYAGYRLDLRNTNLQKADLSDSTLCCALLDGAQMAGASLVSARMEGASLVSARMECADLRATRLKKADLSNAFMEGANLTQSRLNEAHLGGARMEGADLSLTWLGQAQLPEARMQRANLAWAHMEGANLHSAQMQGANLFDAKMDVDTRLTNANLDGSAIFKMNCSATQISLAQFNSAFGDASVTLPNDVVPGHRDWPAHWPVYRLDRRAFNEEWRKWRENPAAYMPPPPP